MNYNDKKEDLITRESMHRQKEERIGKSKQTMGFQQKHIPTEHKDSKSISSGSTTRVEDVEKIQEFAAKINKFKATYGEQEEQDLRDFANENHFDLHVGPPVEKNEKSEIARIAFNGVIKRQDKGLSPTFMRMKNFPYEFKPIENIDYKLEDFKEWEIFEQLPQFRAIKEQILKGFSKAGVTKDMFEKMTLTDFKFILQAHCGAEKGMSSTKLFPELDTSGKPVKDLRTGKTVCTSAKQENTKRFIAEHGEQFKKNLLKLPNIDSKYVETLIHKMATQGLTDMTCYLDKNPEWANQPAINVHHIVNIKDCRAFEAEGKSFADVNNYDNMCFMTTGTLDEMKQKEAGLIDETDSMHDLAHKADMTFKNRNNFSNTPNAIARLKPMKGIRSMTGLGKEHIIFDKDYQEQAKNTQTMQKSGEKTIC